MEMEIARVNCTRYILLNLNDMVFERYFLIATFIMHFVMQGRLGLVSLAIQQSNEILTCLFLSPTLVTGQGDLDIKNGD